MDMLLHAAPLGLPSVFLLLGAVARTRLDKEGIMLHYAKALRLAATVDLVCFDKTGTLTDSVVSVSQSSLSPWVVFCLELQGAWTGMRSCCCVRQDCS